jgi:ABC transport system ATP-binding/permease protein
VDEYLERRRAETEAARTAPPPPRREVPSGAVVRAARKEVQRLERALDRLGERETALHEEMAAHATDHARLGALQDELEAVVAERAALEEAWLERAATLES